MSRRVCVASAGPPETASPERVILIDASSAWHASVIRGLTASRRPGQNWRWLRPGCHANHELFPPGDQNPVGIITDVWHARHLSAAGSFRGFIVSVATEAISPARLAPEAENWWHCHTDSQQACRDAMDCLYACGFRNFAHLGGGTASGAAAELPRYAAKLGVPMIPGKVLPATDADWLPSRPAELDRWVRTLPYPIAVVTDDVRRAEWLLASCERSGVVIPDEVAILSAEDDELACEFHCPAISSIDVAGERVGETAAGLLNSLIDGIVPPSRVVTVPSGPPKLRQSTDTLAIRDTEVIAALQYIRANVRLGIRVKDILAHVPVSRRILEQKFRTALDRSPADAIRREQIHLARRLLENSKLSILRIAHECGFTSQALFSRTFRKLVGVPPATYRKARGRGPVAVDEPDHFQYHSRTA
jgi:LacI family transcriptional regulator